MHSHDHDHVEGQPLQRRTDLERERPDALLFAAGAARRPDVLGGSGLLRLQRAAGNAATAATMAEERSPVLDVVSSGGGQALDAPLRSEMESRLGSDFGDVRVHTGDAAHASAKSVGAHAYTVGSNVVFQRDAYDPSSTAGKTTLAHELTHVVQQRSGPVEGTPSGGGVSISDPSDRFEREAAANAERVMSAPAPGLVAAPVTSAAPAVQREATGVEAPSVQREGAEEEEVQTLRDTSVQRDGEEEEEAPA